MKENIYTKTEFTTQEFVKIALQTLTNKEIASYVKQSENTAKTLKKKINKALNRNEKTKITLLELLKYKGIFIEISINGNTNLAV